MSISTADNSTFLARASAEAGELRFCFTLIGISVTVFLACIPYVRVPLEPSPAFVAVYNAVSTLNDFMTAIILFGQFAILRARALLFLASGYLFASLMSAVQLLAFPGIFATNGLLGAGSQTALWLCIFWHGGFPLGVIVYAVSDERSHMSASSPRKTIATAVAGVVGAVFMCSFAATWGAEDSRILPALLDTSGFTPWQRVVNLTNIILALAAFILLFRRQQRKLIHLWLLVVMGYWLCDVTLSSYLNATRYDLGFFAGRVYGILAASFVLAALVLENSRLHHRLAIATNGLKERATELSMANEAIGNEIAYRERAEEELRRAQAELARVSRITALGELTSSLAHEVNHPIGAIMINAETCLRWLSEKTLNIERARTIASMIVKDGARASETITRMQQIFHKRSLLRELIDVNDVILEMVAPLHGEAERFSVSTRTELMKPLPRVLADRSQLKQALMNLMINGMEAMSDGDNTRELLIKSERGDGGQITISVSDTGVGLPTLLSGRIFHSFVTTKPHSIGIGLSISRAIIEEHGGRLWATNNSSRGAQFLLTLPSSEGGPHNDVVPGA